jgi:hypothetical protein
MSDKPERLVAVPYNLLWAWVSALDALAPTGGPGDSQEITYRDIGNLIPDAIGWLDRARAVLDEADGITPIGEGRVLD